MAQKIKTGDNVVLVTGRDKGKSGKIRRIILGDDGHVHQVVVEGLNMKTKHIKPNAQQQKGGRVRVEAPVHVSNVAVVCPKTNKPTRVRFEDRDGVKHRVAVVSGESLGEVKKNGITTKK
jgi:large subunit ribosomal protein L24